MTRENYDSAMYRRQLDEPVNHSGFNGGEIILAQAASNNGWRAHYGVPPNIGQQLGQRDRDINEEMRRVGPQGQWRPDPRKLREWRDPFDDPYMNRTINDLRQNGIPRVFSPQTPYPGYGNPRPYPGYGNPNGYGNSGYGNDTQQSNSGNGAPRPFFGGDYGYRW